MHDPIGLRLQRAGAGAGLSLMLALVSPAAASELLDPRPLWDFSDPALSESRFRAALAGPVSADDRLVLQTQVARSLGMRRQYTAARQVLDDVRSARDQASAQAAAHWHLEWGRTWCSAAHEPADMHQDAQAQARASFLQAAQMARTAGVDELAVDALHMMAFVDTAPVEAQRWTRQALALATASARPAARRWQASLRNNLGVSLMDQGQPAAALSEFEAALALRRAAAAPDADRRVAEWMVAWALRVMGRSVDALRIQQRLAAENEQAGTPDVEVFEELARLHTVLGDLPAAAKAQARITAIQGSAPK